MISARAMIRAVLVFAALLPFAALAQGTNGTSSVTINRGDLLRNRQYQSVSTLNLFVTSAGSDLNACLDASAPCLTIPGALSKLPKVLQYPTTISVGTGTFAGALISGFEIKPAGVAGAWLSIVGTMSNVTPATGTATGTLTGATAGTAGTLTFATATDSGQTWTVNDLRNRWISITGGTGSGQVRAIASNTGTAITIAGAWVTTPTAGSTYAIVTPGTTIDTGVSVPAASSNAASALNGGKFVLYGVVGSRDDGAPVNGAVNGSDFNFENFNWTNTTTTIAINIYSPRTAVRVAASRPTSASGGVYRCARGDCSLVLESVVHTGVSSSIYSPVSFQNDVLTLSNSVISGTNNSLIFSAASRTSIGNTSITLTTGAVIEDTGGLQGTKLVFARAVSLDCGGSTGRFWRQNSTNQISSSNGELQTVSISNCGTGIQARGARLQLIDVTGTTNTVAIAVEKGGYVLINTGTTITGTSEITLDGTAYTLAALRALVPKQLTDMTTLSSIFEP